MLTHLDLCSGIGGFALAACWAGIETIAFCETDPFCRKVLKRHWPDILKYMDIRDVANPDHVDVLTAGFPCQPFSIAGKQKGKDDDRYLWPEIIRIIRLSRPHWIILENVPGIIPHLDTILEDLEGEAYTWGAYLIPASAVYASHKRERLWIVANRNCERCDKRGDNREERSLQNNWQRYIATLHAEWPQFFPESWTTFNAQDWLGFTANAYGIECHQRTENNESMPIRSKWPHTTTKIVSHDTTFNWQKNKPPIPGVDDGLPNGLDRNKALGNAIVPQIAYLLMKIITLIEG